MIFGIHCKDQLIRFYLIVKGRYSMNLLLVATWHVLVKRRTLTSLICIFLPSPTLVGI